MKYQYSEIDKIFEKLVSCNPELQAIFYAQELENLPYIDVGIISRFIVEQKLKNNTACFDEFFKNAEDIYVNGDEETKNFISVGLFEGIQNIGGEKIDYHSSFDKWLQPNTLKAWKELLDFWDDKDINHKEALH